MKNVIRFATIGTNFIVDRFIEATKECEGLEYGAVYSRKEATAKIFANKYGVKQCYTDLESLAKDETIDAIYIASPNSCHQEQAVMMMEHGKHVLCEKPICSNQRELEVMLKVAKANHVVLLEAIRVVFDPGFFCIQENLHKLGNIRRASFTFCRTSSRYDNYKKGIIENAFDPTLSNGALMDIGVYCVHPLVKLFGKPKKIQASAIFLDNGIDGSGTILATYEGMQAELLYSKIATGILPSEIQGEDATMLIERIQDPRKVSIHYVDGTIENLEIEDPNGNMKYEVREWARLIRNQENAKVHNQYSRLQMELMDEVRNQIGLIFPADTQ